MADIRKSRPTVAVKFRTGPNVSYPDMGVIQSSEDIEFAPITPINLPGDTNRWVPVFAKGKWGWCAAQFIAGAITNTKRHSKIGMHITAGPLPGGLIEMFDRLYRAGRPIASVTVVNHIGLPAAIKKVSPDTFVVARRVFSGNDEVPCVKGVWRSGQEWFDKMWPEQRQFVGADAHQFTNEWFLDNGKPAYEFKRFGQFYAELITAFAKSPETKGKYCTFLDAAPGNLEWDQFLAAKAMFDTAAQTGRGICNYHMYGSPKTETMYDDPVGKTALYTSGRWIAWSKAYPTIKFNFGEGGYYNSPRYRGGADMIVRMKEAEDIIAPYYDRVLGLNWWTFAPTPDWANDSCDPALGVLEAYLMGQ